LGLVFPFAAVGQGNNDIVGNVEKRTKVRLPEGYENPIRNFIANHNVIKDNAQFTEDFIVKEMGTKWGIDDDNQLLFVYCAIGYNYGEDLFTGEDRDKNRMSQFESVLDKVEDCQNRYDKEFTFCLDKRIAEAEQSIAESDRRIMHSDSIGIKHLLEFCDIYFRSPSVVRQEDIDFARETSKIIIANCKKYGIDYRAILLKETGDRKKVDAILKFYEIAD